MKDLIESLPGFRLVMHREIGDDEHAVLLARGGSFSVCVMRPKRRVATSLNYAAGERGLLSGPLNAG